MRALTYSQIRQNLKSEMDRICSDHEPVIITRKSGDNTVMMSYEDFCAIEETAYLLGSPKNAQRLRESLQSFEQGGGMEKELDENE